MANQTVTTIVNYDDPSISGLLDGETLTINGGVVTIDADVRWNQQAAVLGAVTLSSSLGGSFLIDGTQVWEIPFSASTGNVPTQDVLGSNGVLGGTSGATGELTRVWATGSLTPATAGAAMPATGYIKLRTKTGTFQAGETITLPGGATITAVNAGKRSWINVVGREATTLTLPRLGLFSVEGDWYELGVTNGLDNQTFQFPVADLCPAIQIETAPGSGIYEWYTHGANRWINNVGIDAQTVNGTTATVSSIVGPLGALPGGQYQTGTRLRETATTAVHVTASAITASSVDSGNLTFRTFVKKETRRYVFVQAHSGTNRYGALIDLDTGTVVSNRTVGTPTGTSSSISLIGNGWYMVQLTLDHVLANAGSMSVGLANSATPTYDANGLPTYLGLTTEGMYYSEFQVIHPTLEQIPTDVRGKFCYSDETNGIITIAKRTGGPIAGYKPPSGCKVRIPNVILGSAAPVDYSVNSNNSTVATRYDLTTTAAGAVNICNAVCNWYISASSAYSVTIEESCFSATIALTNIASTTTILSCAVSGFRTVSASAITATNCYSGGVINNCTLSRTTTATNGSVLSLSVCKGFSATNNTLITFPPLIGRNVKTALAYTFAITNSDSNSLSNCAYIGGGGNIDTANNTTITNAQYADCMYGTTFAFATYAFAVLTSDKVFIDGFSAYGSIENVHPYAGIASYTTSCANVELRNVGTPANPYNAGTVNAMGLLAAFLATTVNATMRRVYGVNLRTAAISTVNTIQGLRLYNVWADGTDSQVMVAVDALSQGCRWSNPGTVQSAVYGTHWEDAYISETDGRLMIVANEPLASTTNQVSSTFGLGAGFTSAGNASVPNLTDTITWTMPYYALGHTGIASNPDPTNPWAVVGTNQQSLEFQYQFDNGTGFGAWKHLVNQVRRSAGGTTGTNTVTMTAADETALIRKPQIGDFIQAASGRLPAGTTITDITAGVITTSNNFTTTMTSNELLFFWKDIASEVVSPTNGYKLKVKLIVNTANAANLFSFLRIPFNTTAINQQIEYPLPTTQNVGTVSNIRAGSRIRVYNVTTATEIVNEIVSGTTWTYPYDEGTDFTDGDIINIRLARCLGPTATIGYEGTAIASASGWALFAEQSDDIVYNANAVDGTTITEFTFDYPNVQVDISDPDGITTITRLYAWWANERTTEQGIRTLIGGLIAEDLANYKVITSVVDLKLDNTSSTGVLFTGDLRLYRDDGAAPVVSSTTGGGSITLYAGKVYIAETGTSGLTPEEAATLNKLDVIEPLVKLIPATV